MRYEIRPFTGGQWTDPTTIERRSAAAFRAPWGSTLDLLYYETEILGATLVVLQVDVTEGDLRRDGMLRANAKVGHPGVVISFESEHGPLRYATDAYDEWRANVRATALALKALRAVDRYGVTRRGEQYVGWRALAAPVSGFASVDEAIRWMRERGGPGHVRTRPDLLYRVLAKRFHPDAGGDPGDWHRLDEARRLLDLTGAAS